MAGRSSGACPRTGARRASGSTIDDEDQASARLRCSAPLNPAGAARRCASTRRGGRRPPADAVQRLLAPARRGARRRDARARRAGEAAAGPRTRAAALGGPGTRLSRRCRPTGVTSTARSSSTPATGSTGRALLLAPVNPARAGGEPGLRFRVARARGYGASPPMTRRCLERLDEEGIRGELEDPARALRHGARRHAGAGLVRRGAGRVNEQPVSWLLIERAGRSSARTASTSAKWKRSKARVTSSAASWSRPTCSASPASCP